MCIKIKIIRTDNGGEFQRGELVAEWDRKCINIKSNITFSQHQNEVTERVFQDIVTHIIYILNDANLPVFFWYEISQSIVRLKNLWPHLKINKTPYKVIWCYGYPSYPPRHATRVWGIEPRTSVRTFLSSLD